MPMWNTKFDEHKPLQIYNFVSVNIAVNLSGWVKINMGLSSQSLPRKRIRFYSPSLSLFSSSKSCQISVFLLKHLSINYACLFSDAIGTCWLRITGCIAFVCQAGLQSPRHGLYKWTCVTWWAPWWPHPVLLLPIYLSYWPQGMSLRIRAFFRLLFFLMSNSVHGKLTVWKCFGLDFLLKCIAVWHRNTWCVVI